MVNYKLPIIALVGPPNTGKSTLLNKIIKEQKAVTSKIAGTTRDRQYVDASFNGVDFTIADTAGLNFETQNELEKNVRKQIEFALKEADIIVMIVDGKAPVNAVDKNVLSKFRKINKPKILAVNKIDSPQKRDISNFQKLGIKPIFPISSVTGAGIGDLLEHIASIISDFPSPLNIGQAGGEVINRANPAIPVSIVGKPNVGKSSLFNKILSHERAVVSAVPGTTRTSIDDKIIMNGINYTFIDTAGLKKKSHGQEEPDIFSSFQTFKSIRRSDVCFLVLEAIEPITMQDKKIAQEIFKMQKGCVIICNKIDLYKGHERQLQDYISHNFPFLWMCPVFFVSAITGSGVLGAIKAIKPIYDRRNKKIDNQTLAKFLIKILKKQPPRRMWDQKAPKVFSLKQTDVNPPTFELTVNFPAAISQHFRHFLENSIIRELDFYGTSIKLHLTRKIGR